MSERIGFEPIDASGTNILELPVRRPVDPESGPFLVPPPASACQHYGGFEVDIKGGKCLCKVCKGEVSPMFVLERLMHQESQWRRTLETYQDSMRRLGERSRTKCRHCGKMTDIRGA